MSPSPTAIIWNDWPALASFVAIPIMWVIYFLFPLLKPGASIGGLFLLVPAISTLLLLSSLIWRIMRINKLFEAGIEVPGEIIGLSIIRDRGRLEYAYEWRDGMLFSWIPVHKTKRVLGFSKRKKVHVLVDPTDPKKSVVRELFE